MRRVDVTIVGGGPVGLFAAFYAGMRGMSVRILDSLEELGGQLVALYPEKYVYDMPGFPKILAKDLASEMIAQGSAFSPEIVLGLTAETLHEESEGYAIVTQDGRRWPTRTVIVSAGAGAFSPTKLGVDREGEFEGRGLSYGVRHTEDFRDKRVAIVGGGDSAFDWCLHLHPVARSVTLIHRRDQFRAHEESVRRVRESGVEMKLWRTVQELRGEGRIQEIEMENSQTGERELLPVDALVVTIGFKSSLGPLKDWSLGITRNQIEVHPTTFETCRKGVFAVGDVCAYENKLKLIATGVGEAVTAVCVAKTYLDPGAKLFPGHSSDMDLGL